MRTSPAGIALIEHFEGCKLVAFPDGGGVFTIGWGHTGRDVHPGLVWTQVQADAMFLYTDLPRYEAGVLRELKRPALQCQFDSLVSFAFNAGLDEDEDTKAEGLGDSSLLRYFNEGLIDKAADEFLKWNHVHGVVEAGLTLRRAAERKMFKGESWQ